MVVDLSYTSIMRWQKYEPEYTHSMVISTWHITLQDGCFEFWEGMRAVSSKMTVGNQSLWRTPGPNEPSLATCDLEFYCKSEGGSLKHVWIDRCANI